MDDTTSQQPHELKQLNLPGIEAMLREQGIGELPEGLSRMTRRESNFVLRLLQHGNATRAATEAGYSADSARAIASETLRKPDVFRFYQRCLSQVANNAEMLVRRVYERSALWHAKTLECAQARQDLDELVKTTQSLRVGVETSGHTTECETKRERMVREEKHYATLANQTDTLLASLLGKLQVNVSGTLNHNHVVLTPDLSAKLVEARRRVMANPEAVTNGRN